MQILSIYDDEFRSYGRVLENVPTELIDPVVGAMKEYVLLPEPTGTAYDTSLPVLESLDVAPQLGQLCFGDMPFQLGCVRGRNTLLNCLEYHRTSEFNVGTDDLVLLLAHEWEVERDADGAAFLDTARVKAFRAPAGVLFETFATTMHYTPCHVDEQAGFRMLVALPRGTNEPLSEAALAARDAVATSADAQMLWCANKYLFAHAESSEATQGAYVGLRGENWDIAR